MYWSIETEIGSLEGNRIRELLLDIASHFVQQDEPLPELKSIFINYNDDRERKICGIAVTQANNFLYNNYKELVEEYEESCHTSHIGSLRAEYYSSVL